MREAIFNDEKIFYFIAHSKLNYLYQADALEERLMVGRLRRNQLVAVNVLLENIGSRLKMKCVEIDLIELTLRRIFTPYVVFIHYKNRITAAIAAGQAVKINMKPGECERCDSAAICPILNAYQKALFRFAILSVVPNVSVNDS